MGYAFQIYALFVASSDSINELYQQLLQSLLQPSNWNKDVKHLIPSLGQFIIAMVCKFPEQMKQHAATIGEIILHLLSTEIRMETVALQMSSALFERVGIFSEEVLNKILFGIFTCMHYYRNNTKNKVIPGSITRTIHIFFATFMINFGSDALIQACDKV